MKIALVVYNPVSGTKNLVNLRKLIVNELKKNNWDHIWFETINSKKQPLEQFLKSKFDLIIIAGGDGTVNEVANFVIQNKLKIPIAIVAQGTGNLFAQTLKIPVLNPRNAMKLALSDEVESVDVMRINEKHLGLIAAGQGYDVIFIKGATRNLKRKFGIFAYIYSFLKTVFTCRRHSYKIKIDGEQYNVKAKLVAVFNVHAMLKFTTNRRVKPNDGLLNIAILNPTSLWDLFRILVKSALHKISPNDKKIRWLTRKEIYIKESDASHIQIDGEIKKAKELKIQIIPNAIQIKCKKIM